MINFIYFTSQTSFIVIKLLRKSALRPQTEFNNQFVVMIKTGVIITLMYLLVLKNIFCISHWILPLTIFKERVSFNTKVVMLRCFIREIISINIFFVMYWMLPLSSRIAPENFTLPLRYLKQNLSPMPISFYGIIDYTAK